MILLWIELGLPADVSIYPQSEFAYSADRARRATPPASGIYHTTLLTAVMTFYLHHPKPFLDSGAIVFHGGDGSGNALTSLCRLSPTAEGREEKRNEIISYLVEKRGFLRVLNDEPSPKSVELRRRGGPSAKVLSILDSGLIKAKVCFSFVVACVFYISLILFHFVYDQLTALGSTREWHSGWIGRCRYTHLVENASHLEKTLSVKLCV